MHVHMHTNAINASPGHCDALKVNWVDPRLPAPGGCLALGPMCSLVCAAPQIQVE